MTIAEIAEEFQFVEPQDRLEIMLDYARRLPPLPEAYHLLRDRGLNMVHECQSPVFMMVEVEDGMVQIHADVPEEAPTARSFVAILVEAFDDAPVEAVREAPPDLLHTLGIDRLIGMQRTRGLRAIYARLKNAVPIILRAVTINEIGVGLAGDIGNVSG